MADDKRQEEEDCANAFRTGNKFVAEQLLPRIPQPAAVTTTFPFSKYPDALELVSLLHLAAYWGWINVVNALVSVYKCAADSKDELEHTPLHYAACNGHLEVVKYFLVKLLCDPMDRNSFGETPLHFACSNGQLQIAQYFIREKQCNPSCENNNGYTPLHYACINGHFNIAQYLIREEHCNPSCENNKNGNTPLHDACDNNHAHIVQYLLSTGRVNPLAKNKAGRTALYYASGKYDIIKLFQPFKDDLPSDLSTAAGSSTGFLYGVDVHGETVLEVVGDKPQKLKWPGYGFYIEVPQGALPPGVTASVRVEVILGGQFQFPEKSQLISAIYAVISSEVFLKEVAINIKHCAVIKTKEQCSSFRFIIAKCSQEVLPYTFREREGNFNPHTQYGTIKLKRFSLIGLTAPTDTVTRCTALMFYKEQIPSPLVAHFHFVVVRDLEAYVQRVHKQYQGWSKDNASLKFCFDSNTTLQLDQQEQQVDSWRIQPLSLPLQVTNGDVCNFKQGGSIPHCSFELRFEHYCGLKTFQHLFHKVDVLGISSPASFHICYPQPDGNKVQAIPSRSIQSGSPHSSSSSARRHSDSQQSTAAQSYLDSLLTVRQLLIACESVTDWYTLGIHLGLTTSQLDNIRVTYHVNNLKTEMFTVWLKSSPNASWADLIIALKDMDEHRVARDVRAVYSPTTSFLSGLDVHGETVLEVVGDKPQKLEWPGYGFYIEVPKGALPPGVTASVRVKVILGGQFQFPENSQLISAIYWVSSSDVFLKEVAVNIQHCAVIKTKEQCSSFRFIIAQKVLPYKFKECEGEFNPHSQYGTVKLKRFSLIGETGPPDTKTHCTALMFYKKQIPSPLVAVFHFVVVRDLKSYLKYVDKEYQGWSKDDTSLKLCFDSNTIIQLDQQEQIVDSWRILPLMHPQVTSDDICSFKKGRRIPHCSFRLCLLPGKTLQQLFHRVNLTGVDASFIVICYPQADGNKVSVTPSSSTQPASSSTSASHHSDSQQTPAPAQSNSGSCLTVKRLVTACKRVTDWHRLGIQLDLTMAQLENIHVTCAGKGIHTIDNLKTFIFDAWLKSSPNATWADLITALRAMSEHTVASAIEAANTPAEQDPAVTVPISEQESIASEQDPTAPNPVTSQQDAVTVPISEQEPVASEQNPTAPNPVTSPIALDLFSDPNHPIPEPAVLNPVTAKQDPVSNLVPLVQEPAVPNPVTSEQVPVSDQKPTVSKVQEPVVPDPVVLNPDKGAQVSGWQQMRMQLFQFLRSYCCEVLATIFAVLGICVLLLYQYWT